MWHAFAGLPDWRLLIVGRIADAYAAASPQPSPRREPAVIGDHVDGATLDLAFAAADLVVLSFRPHHSRDSGVLMDAIAWGVPVVCSARSAVVDVVTAYGLGVLRTGGEREQRRQRSALITVVAIAVAFGSPVVLYFMLWSADATRGTRPDDFSRADSVVEIGPVARAGRWDSLSGVWGIENGAAYLVKPRKAASLAVYPAHSRDGRVSAALASAADGAGIAFRVRDARNLWAIVATSAYATWNIVRYHDGVPEFVANTGLTSTSGEHTVAVQFEGNRITVFIDGIELKRVTSQALRDAGGVGLVATHPDSRAARWSSFAFAPAG